MLTAVNEQPILSTLRNKDLIYSELLDELKTAHSLLSEVKCLSAELQEAINTLKDEAENQYLKFEHLPDYVDIKILKEYLKVGTNLIYELTRIAGNTFQDQNLVFTTGKGTLIGPRNFTRKFEALREGQACQVISIFTD